MTYFLQICRLYMTWSDCFHFVTLPNVTRLPKINIPTLYTPWQYYKNQHPLLSIRYCKIFIYLTGHWNIVVWFVYSESCKPAVLPIASRHIIYKAFSIYFYRFLIFFCGAAISVLASRSVSRFPTLNWIGNTAEFSTIKFSPYHVSC